MALYNISSPSGGGEADGPVYHGRAQTHGNRLPERQAWQHLRGQRQPEKLPLCRGTHGRSAPPQDRHVCSPPCRGIDDCRIRP